MLICLRLPQALLHRFVECIIVCVWEPRQSVSLPLFARYWVAHRVGNANKCYQSCCELVVASHAMSVEVASEHEMAETVAMLMLILVVDVDDYLSLSCACVVICGTIVVELLINRSKDPQVWLRRHRLYALIDRTASLALFKETTSMKWIYSERFDQERGLVLREEHGAKD